jgi:hypothetical protein
MKIIKTLGLTLAAAGMMTLTAQAVQITGHISFSTASGTWTGGGGNVNTIDTITSFGTVEVNSSSGDFSGILNNTPVTMGEPLKFTAVVSIINPFWAVGGFEFDLLAITSITRDDNPLGLDTLTLAGTGTIRDTVGSLEDTIGIWAWSGEMNGTATFTFSSTTVASPSVPDGGTTVMLLGAALSGLGLFRRKLA